MRWRVGLQEAHEFGAQWGYWSTVENRWVAEPLADDDKQIRIEVPFLFP